MYGFQTIQIYKFCNHIDEKMTQSISKEKLGKLLGF
jgi:hypothetical protein